MIAMPDKDQTGAFVLIVTSICPLHLLFWFILKHPMAAAMQRIRTIRQQVMVVCRTGTVHMPRPGTLWQ